MSPARIARTNAFAIWRPPYRGRQLLAIGFVGMLAVAMAYYSVYLNTLIAPGYNRTVNRLTGQQAITVVPCYSFENQVPAKYSKLFVKFLYPAHLLDKRFRSGYWSENRYPSNPQ